MKFYIPNNYSKRILSIAIVAIFFPSHAIAANDTLPTNGIFDIDKEYYSADGITIPKNSTQTYNFSNKATFATFNNGLIFDDSSNTTINNNGLAHEGYNFCVDNSGYYGAMNLNKGANLTINKGKLKFTSRGSEVVELWESAKLTIDADELIIQASGLSKDNISKRRSDALQIQNDGSIDFRISDKFSVTSDYYSAINFDNPDVYISSKAIDINAAYEQGSSGQNIRNGIEIEQNEGKNASTEIKALDDIDIRAGDRGIDIEDVSRYGSSFDLVSENGNVTVNSMGTGIYMMNWTGFSKEDEEERIQKKITAGNDVTICTPEIALYLKKNISLLVQGNKSITFESTGSPGVDYCAVVVRQNSDLDLKTPKLNIKSDSDNAVLAEHGGQVNINTSNASIYGKLEIKTWDWAESVRDTKISINNSNMLIIDPKYGDAIVSKGGIVDIKSNVIRMKGDVKTSQGAEVYIKSTGSTLFSGSTNKERNDIISLDFGNESVWNVEKDSYLTSLKLRDSTIDFTPSDPFISVTTDSLNAKNGILRLKIGYDNNDWSSNQLIVNESANGNLVADIVFNIKALPDLENPSYIPTWLVSQGENSKLSIHNFKGKSLFSGKGMVSVWALSFVPENELEKLNDPDNLNVFASKNLGEGAGKWFLIYADRDSDSIYPPNNTDGDQNGSNPAPDNESGNNQPIKPPVEDPAEIQQILDLGVSSMQAMSFASELDDLRARTGEVRHGVSDGAWARASYQKERIFGENSRTLKQETQDLHIGLDHLIPASNDSAWLLGSALRYATSDQKGVGQFTNEGELQQYSAKLYATYLHDAGSYVDFVIQAGRYDQELEGVANDGYSKFSADYKTYGYGLSAEMGHQFALGNGLKSQFNPFVEPQMQLSYFMAKGKDFTTSTGMKISQSDADFLTGRLGVVLGNTFKYEDGANPRFFQIAFTGGMKYEFMGDQTVRFTGVEGLSKTRRADDIDGARFYYGFTSDWKVSDTLRAFAKLEREEGHHYTKDFDVSVGVRYQF